MKDSYEKRLNILIHGKPEIRESAWEAPTQTLGHIHNFMEDGFKISDPMTIQLADYHRLPQTPVYKNGNRVNRPIILKLTNAADKRRIFNDVKNLKSYNEKRKGDESRYGVYNRTTAQIISKRAQIVDAIL